MARQSKCSRRVAVQFARTATEWTQHVVIAQRRKEVQRLEEYLEQWTLQCPLCVVRRQDGHRHSIEEFLQEGADIIQEGADIIQEEADIIQEEIVDLQEQVPFERFSYCFYCHVPQAICQWWEPGETISVGGRFQGKGVSFQELSFRQLLVHYRSRSNG